MVSLAGIGGNVITIVIQARDKFSKVLSKTKLSLQGFQKAGLAAGAVAAGIGLAFKSAISANIEFQGSMNESIAIMGNVSDVMRNEMSNAAREVGKTTLISANQAAEAFFFLASAGLTVEQQIASLPQVAAFAQAGMFDMSTATDLATDAQSALGLTVKDAAENLKGMTRVTDVLVKANTLANASVQQFAEALTSEAGAALKTFNKDVEEGVAVLAAMADQGVKGQKAGTDLSRIMRLLSKSYLNNKVALKRLNIEIFNSEGNMNNFADIIGDMEVAFDDMSDAERTAALDAIGFTARVQGVILPLLGTSDAIREYEKELRNAGGTTQEVANNQMTSLESQITLLKNRFNELSIGIGERLAPILERILIPVLDKMIKLWDSLSPTIQTAIIAGVAATGMVLALAAAVAILTLISSPWLLIVFAIAAAIGILVAIGVLLWKNWDTIKEKAKPFVDFLKSVFAPQIIALRIAVKLLGIAFEFMWDNFIKPVWDKFKDFINWLERTVLPIIKKIGGILSGISGAVKGASNFIAGKVGVKKVTDFILRPDGQLIETDPKDTIIGTKNPGGLGGGLTLIIQGDVFGTDPEEIAEALNDKIRTKISI